MAHGDAREGKGMGNWRMECVASILHTTTEHGVSSINTADAASSRPNWRPRRFKRTRPFRRETKSGFCACAITFQKQSNSQFLCIVFELLPHSCQHYKIYWYLHVKRPTFPSDFLGGKFGFSRQMSIQVPNIKFHKNTSSGSTVDVCGQTDGQILRR